MSTFTARAAAALTAAAATLTLAGSAQAADATFADRAGDIAHRADLRSVSVHNGADRVRVTLTLDDLVRSARPGTSGTVYVDRNAANPGPEYAFVGGFFAGTDYTLLSVRGWRLGRGAEPVDCDYSMRLHYRSDTVALRFDQGCFRNAHRLRFEVRTGGRQPDGDQVVDWLGPKHRFTRWVDRG